MHPLRGPPRRRHNGADADEVSGIRARTDTRAPAPTPRHPLRTGDERAGGGRRPAGGQLLLLPLLLLLLLLLLMLLLLLLQPLPPLRDCCCR